MDDSSYLSGSFLDIEEILDLQLVNHTDEFKATDYSGLRYNSQGDLVLIDLTAFVVLIKLFLCFVSGI